jgi:hypothetical protein
MTQQKDWLIRTKSNHILGPVSKEKVLELYKNGSIKQDDEVCSGNGFWFFVREDDLVTKYLLGNEDQGFNPISEAKDVLTAPLNKPRYEPTRDDITLVTNVDSFKSPVKEVQPTPESKAAPKARTTTKDDSKPNKIEQKVVEQPAPIESFQEAKASKKKVKDEVRIKPSGKVQTKALKKQNYLYYLAFLGILSLMLLVYYRKDIIKSFLSDHDLPSISIIADAEAQDEATKKKSF